MLSIGSVIYLGSLPWGWKSYRDHERNAALAAQPAAVAEAAAPSSPAPTFSPAPGDTEDDRPARLN
jgi:CDP-diacylglycerol--serine O-phosphatidyltransferase